MKHLMRVHVSENFPISMGRQIPFHAEHRFIKHNYLGLKIATSSGETNSRAGCRKAWWCGPELLPKMSWGTEMRRFPYFLILAIGLLASLPTRAAIINLDRSFSATNFVRLTTPVVSVPVDPVTGRFTVTFNNAADITNQTAGISISGLNVVLGSAIAFSYERATDTLFVGGLEQNADAVFNGTNDFTLIIGNVSTAPDLLEMVYTQAGIATYGTSTFITPAVPEPSSLALLAVGLAGFAALRRRARRVPIAAA